MAPSQACPSCLLYLYPASGPRPGCAPHSSLPSYPGLASHSHVHPWPVPGGCQDLINCRAAKAAFVPSSSAEEINTVNGEKLGCDVETGDGPRGPESAHLLGMEGLSPSGKLREQSGPQAPGLAEQSDHPRRHRNARREKLSPRVRHRSRCAGEGRGRRQKDVRGWGATRSPGGASGRTLAINSPGTGAAGCQAARPAGRCGLCRFLRAEQQGSR